MINKFRPKNKILKFFLSRREIKSKRGVSLVEVLIYTGLIAVTSTIIGGILISVLRIQGQQGATVEVNQQLNFVMQNIQRFVRDSSLIEAEAGVTTSSLTLRMEDSVNDPTEIYLSNNVIYLKRGSQSPMAITNDRVSVDSLEFFKTSSYPGHDSIQIDLTISYNTEVAQEAFSKNLTSAIARVSAATFDSDLVPGSTNSYDIGLSGTEWRHLNLSGDLTLSGLLTVGSMSVDPSGLNGAIYYNTTDNKFKGYKNGSWEEIGGGQWTLNGNNIYNSNSGNVGIGTQNPGSLLEVSGATNPKIRVTDTTNTVQIELLALDSSGVLQTGSNHSLTFATNGGVAQMTLLTDGNFGIGNVNPQAKLDVTGDIKISGNTTFNNVAYTWPASDGTSNQVLTTDGSGNLSWTTVSSEEPLPPLPPPPPPPSNGLVLHMSFSEGSGGTTADESASNNSGSITGATWTTGAVGAGLNFDGNDDWVDLSSSSGIARSSTEGWSIFAWVYQPAINTFDVIINQNLIPCSNYIYGLFINNGKVRVGTNWLCVGGWSLDGDTTIEIGQWNLIGATRDGSTKEVKIYINGIIDKTGTDSQGGERSNNSFRIGATLDGNAEFKGLMDELVVYDRVLAQSEIDELYSRR